MLSTLLQIPTVTSTPASTTPPAVDQELHIFELLVKGGPIMIPIAILLVLAIYLWIYKSITISQLSRMDERMIPAIKDQLTSGNLSSAEAYVRNINTAQARVIDSGIATLGRSMREIESNLETASEIEIMQMEKHLGYMGIIAGIAPMLGFIGTIAGVIKIFYNISVSNDISISIISSGLYEKMITSGFGLLTGIIAYGGYHLLNMKIDRTALKLQRNSFEFIRIINKSE
ncbi:MAG TPA: MotA/TolQ/ExbB proton channel family protein [Chitinophagales bacterium]|nr:MotA/TolQ/ExbB proton channel family protein [Chitinophagales bacterium]HMU70647.1 MotA/TolQ/ExbB proton channel family protein [Chitinophagales bacterium]HMX05812.1 MotA/TolQ/ExbB proton channel family protein [Chitinophagales bacterium]HMZ90299.1 MotA/TolQ/ExbB proton channel family protein [Chitinophagales bacterium]HNA58811.1 MotA/TolQ/ExbB proton channel family protein [Chitinophagales bacterium]